MDEHMAALAAIGSNPLLIGKVISTEVKMYSRYGHEDE